MVSDQDFQELVDQVKINMRTISALLTRVDILEKKLQDLLEDYANAVVRG